MNKKLLFLLLSPNGWSDMAYTSSFVATPNNSSGLGGGSTDTSSLVLVGGSIMVGGILLRLSMSKQNSGHSSADAQNDYKKNNYPPSSHEYTLHIIKEKQIQICNNYLQILRNLIQHSDMSSKRIKIREIDDFIKQMNLINIHKLGLIQVGNAITKIGEKIPTFSKKDQMGLTKKQLDIYFECKYLYPCPDSLQTLETELYNSSPDHIIQPLTAQVINDLDASLREQRGYLDALKHSDTY